MTDTAPTVYKFTYREGFAYYCNQQHDNSGEYVKLSEYEALRATVATLTARAEVAVKTQDWLQGECDAAVKDLEEANSRIVELVARAQTAEAERDYHQDDAQKWATLAHKAANERDEARAQVEALRDAANRLIASGLISWDDLGTHCAACGGDEEWAGDHHAINHTPDCTLVALRAALIQSAAVAQKEKAQE